MLRSSACPYFCCTAKRVTIEANISPDKKLKNLCVEVNLERMFVIGNDHLQKPELEEVKNILKIFQKRNPKSWQRLLKKELCV